MRKFTALGLFLLALIGFTAKADITCTWSIEEGATVESFTEATFTLSGIDMAFDGNYGNSSDCGLYSEDGTQISSFGWSWCPYSMDIVDGSVSFTVAVQSDQTYPDYPVATKGNYYLKICKGFFRSFPNGSSDWQNYIELPELRVNFKIEPTPGYVSRDNVTATPAEGNLTSLPEAFVITLDNEDLTSIEFVGDEKPKYYQNSWTSYDLDVEIEGNTIKLIPSETLKNAFADMYEGNYRVILFANSFKFNGDDAKTNDLIQLWYTIPETAEWNTYLTFPAPPERRWDYDIYDYVTIPSIVSSLGRVELYVYEQGAEMIVPEEAQDMSNVPYVAYYDEQFSQWIPIAFYDEEVIPSVMDQNGELSYPGVKLSFKPEYAGMVFPEGTYRVIVPAGAYTVNVPESRYGDPAKTLPTKAYSVEYQLATAPEVSTTAVWGIEDGAVLESFEGTTLKFEGVKNVKLVDEYGVSAMLYKKNANGTETELGKMTIGVCDSSTDWNTVIEVAEDGTFGVTMDPDVFNPYYPLDVDGEYCIRMPFNALKFEGFSDLVNEASEVNFSISSKSLLKDAQSTIDPAPCEISAFPEKLTITFTNEEIKTLDLGIVTEQRYYDEEGNYNPHTVEVPAKAGLICDFGYYAYQVGSYLMEINPENPKQVILTPDPSSISSDATLQYGSYKFRISRGGLIANKGTETESACSIMEWGNYDNIQRFPGQIYNPVVGEEVEELYSFSIKYTDGSGNDAYGELQLGDATAAMYAFDAMTNDWVHYSDLVSEIVVDKTMGIEVPTVRLPWEPVFGSGRYKVVIPRNTFKFYDYGATIPGDAIEAEYEINTGVKPYDITVTPAEGDVPFIDDITFTFNDWWMSSVWVANPDWSMRMENAAVAVDAEGNVLGYATVSTEYGENWAMYQKIDFEPAIRQEGAVKVIVGWNVFDSDYDMVGDTEGFTFNYNIVPGAPELVVTPADGEEVKELVNFTLTWNGATEVEINPDLMVGGAKLYAVTENGKELQSDLICSPAGDKSVVLDIMDLAKPMPNGQYVLEVPAEMFTANGFANEALTATYTLAGLVYNFEVLEAPFNKIKLTVENCDELKVREDCAEKATLWYVTGGEKQVGEYNVVSVGDNVVELTLTEAVEAVDGDYIVWLPEGYFWVGNDQSKDIKFAIDGVVSIEDIAEDANFDIVNVNGMVIKRNGNKADLKALDPGIYVVNGKKVLVK
ncbi:MAG: hypothetical protein IKU16_09020 [Muribaculaceae bacterium]|nr:hypothetical protein [Muribaculaceae bacterium]